MDQCFIFEFTSEIKLLAIAIKQRYKIKLPDAIIAATAIVFNIPLITADADFQSIEELNLIFLER